MNMPGDGCAYHMKGHCLYAESVNPGYHAEWRCRVLKKWEEAYDHFMCQADNFRLDIKTAGMIWEQRLSRLMLREGRCPNFVTSRGRSPLDCCHIYDTLCLLALPRCVGKCRNYVLKKDRITG